ncbi:MAG: hypothetical protein Q7V62_03575 [Actinomycetota bacterium]|nr:hypothetical protein [Actinomycetota bacterium]
MKHNPVARHAHRFNRCTRHKQAKHYQRNEKHRGDARKARQKDDFGGPFALWRRAA